MKKRETLLSYNAPEIEVETIDVELGFKETEPGSSEGTGEEEW